MDKVDIFKCALTVAGRAAEIKHPAGVAKLVATDFLPSLIDFIDEKMIVARAKREREAAMNAEKEEISSTPTNPDPSDVL